MGIVSYIVPILVVVLVLKILALPLKIIKAFIINAIIGGILLYVLSAVGIITIALTWWVIALVGLFGVPGVIIAIILSIL